MENFNPGAYRKELAKDLKTIRKVDPEAAQKVLENEQETRGYNVSRAETILDRKEEEQQFQKLLMSSEPDYDKIFAITGYSGVRFNEVSDLIVARLDRLMRTKKEQLPQEINNITSSIGTDNRFKPEVVAIAQKVKSPEMIETLTQMGVELFKKYLKTTEYDGNLEYFELLKQNIPELGESIAQKIHSDEYMKKFITETPNNRVRDDFRRITGQSFK